MCSLLYFCLIAKENSTTLMTMPCIQHTTILDKISSKHLPHHPPLERHPISIADNPNSECYIERLSRPPIFKKLYKLNEKMYILINSSSYFGIETHVFFHFKKKTQVFFVSWQFLHHFSSYMGRD